MALRNCINQIEALKKICLSPNHFNNDNEQAQQTCVFYNGNCLSELPERENSWHLEFPAHFSGLCFLIFIQDAECDNKAISLPISLKLKENQHITLVETHLVLSEKTPMDIKVQVQLASDSRLEHIIIKQPSKNLVLDDYQHLLNVDQQQNSRYRAHYLSLDFCGKTNLAAQLKKTGAEFHFKHLLWQKKNNSELNLVVEHHAEHATTDIIARSLIERGAKGKCQAKVIILPGSHFADVNLENKAILLGKNAEMQIQPDFEVYTKELLRCSHGVSVGYLDQEAIAYLQNRGLSYVEAESVLMDAVMQQILASLPENIKEKILPFLKTLMQVGEEYVVG